MQRVNDHGTDGLGEQHKCSQARMAGKQCQCKHEGQIGEIKARVGPSLSEEYKVFELKIEKVYLRDT